MSSQHHLFIVDDEEGILELLSRRFTDWGYRVTPMPGAEQALNILKDVRPDLILADYWMPSMNGIELFKQTQTVCPDAVRLLMTAYGNLNVATAAINEARVYKFIPKPWDDRDLLLTVQRALEHRDLIVESRAFADTLELMVDENVQEIERLRTALRTVAEKVRSHLS
ncbi:MAG: response regulator [Candidatus Latescibacteria bacterium]|nr:response regulator [Candidatus Latescibacterota bacterium]